jgi:23S rRNA (guanosine2251-2'-O)-methyltransferase
MRKLKLEELGRSGIEEFQNQKKLPVTLLLDSVRSMHNVGSAFRTSDAFAIEQLFLCGITGLPPHREIEKTALGATQSVKWKHFENISEAITQLKANGYQIIAIEQAENSTKLTEFQPAPDQKYALIFGNEVDGVSDEAMELADDCIEIPQFGTKHSFNIVVTAGIVLWDFYNKIVK